MSAFAEVKTGLDQATEAVDVARELLAGGQLIDLSELEKHLERMCEEIVSLPGPEATQLKNTLIGLISSLDGLANSISTQNRNIESELKELSSHQKAATAYRPSPTGPKKPPGK